MTKWRNRFTERRREGLLDEPRPGGPRTVTDEQVEKIVTTTLESTPNNVTHWARSLAAHLGVSQDAVSRTWHAFGVQPRRQEKFKLSADPQFVEKGYDIRSLYLNAPERTMVLCIDDRLANPKLLRIRRQRIDLSKPFQPAWKGSRHPPSPYLSHDASIGPPLGQRHPRGERAR